MKPLILSFFSILLIYSLFFDDDKKKEDTESPVIYKENAVQTPKSQMESPGDSVNFAEVITKSSVKNIRMFAY